MISNNKLIKKYNGNLLKVMRERENITDTIIKALRSYFKALNLNYGVRSYNNGDISINCKNEVFPLYKLLEKHNISFSVEKKCNLTVYRIYIFN